MFILSHYLTGRAHEFYIREVADDPYRWRLPKFFRELFNYCFPVDFRSKQRFKLQKCRQNDRSVRDFLYDLNELWNTIGETAERAKVNKFWFGLRRKIQQDLWKEKLNPEVLRLKDVVSAAEILEIAQSVMDDIGPSQSRRRSRQTESAMAYKKRKNKNRRHKGGKRNYTLYPDSETLEKGTSGYKPKRPGPDYSKPGYKKPREFNPRRPKMSREEHERHQAEGLCFRCHKPGHFTCNCPEANKEASTSKVTSQNVDIDFGNVESLREMSENSRRAGRIEFNMMEPIELVPEQPSDYMPRPGEIGEPLSERAARRLAEGMIYPGDDPYHPIRPIEDRFLVYQTVGG